MNVTKNILSGVIAVAVFGLFATVFAWTGPTAAPAGNNTAAPINTSALTQTKTGNLAITGLNADGVAYQTGLRVYNGSTVLGVAGVPQMTFGPTTQSIGNTPSINSDPYALQILGPMAFPAAYGQDTGMAALYPFSVFAYPGYQTPAGSSAPAGNYIRGNTYFADHGGRVGIGITNPTQKLDVVGNIHASGTICSGSGTNQKCLSSSQTSQTIKHGLANLACGSYGTPAALYVAFPSAFPAGTIPDVSLTSNWARYSGDEAPSWWISNLTNTGFTINVHTASSGGCVGTSGVHWIAISN